MRNSNRWRNKRRLERYRRISEKIGDGMYALALLEAFSDEPLDFEIEDRTQNIKSRLESCIVLIDDMYETSMDSTTGCIEQITLIEDLELSSDELSQLQTSLEWSLTKFEPHPNFKNIYDTLRKIEQYAKQRADQYNKTLK